MGQTEEKVTYYYWVAEGTCKNRTRRPTLVRDFKKIV